MPLSAGTRIGPYEVLSSIGQGGMGEVYRARDSRLNRDVALKILPEAFAADADRLARFTREAQTLAALNHPNIAHIHGLEEAGGVRALIMELVEGEDLSTLVARGPITPADAVPIARQIAEALEAAHEQGIIHRDLKPANVKVRADGTVKVLDFGLAKALDTSSPGAPAHDAPRTTHDAPRTGTEHGAQSTEHVTQLPTMTSPALTAMGVILGTAAYMAPEQAKGRAVDKRADIWAFGVVVYEMLSGRRAFEGEDMSTTLAAVLMRDPDWTSLPASTPPALRHLVGRCLERDPRVRLRDIGEARVVLGSPEATGAAPAPVGTRAAAAAAASRVAWGIAAACAAAAIVFAVLWAGGRTASLQTSRIEASIAPPAGSSYGGSVALSPDGTRLLFEAIDDESGVPSLWVRDLSSATPVRVSHTESGTLPFWSPDGREFAFFAEGKLKRTDLDGSPPQVICDAPSPRGGAWGPDDTIVFSGTFRTGLARVSASGGTPAALTTLDESRGEKSHRWPVFLPGGAELLFLAQTGEATAKDDTSTIEAITLATGERARLVSANSSPLYSTDGFLLFWREGALRAQAFDADRLVVSGGVSAVATDVAFDVNELAVASISGGNLVYMPGAVASRSNLMLVDRAGRPIRTIAESTLTEGGMALSPDGTRLAVGLTADGAKDSDIWVFDFARGTSGPLTFDDGPDAYPVWSADGDEIVYANLARSDGVIYRRFADGSGQPVETGTNVSGMWTWGWSKPGEWLLVGAVADATSMDLLRYDVAGRTLTPLVNSPFNEDAGALSPDGRFLAYQSDETGRFEVYVQSIADGSGRWRISTAGGVSPLWRNDGRELYFLTSQGQMMAVEVSAGGAFRASPPTELFRADFDTSGTFRATAGLGTLMYAPFPDGQRFVIDVLRERRTTLLTLVTNWSAGVTRN